MKTAPLFRCNLRMIWRRPDIALPSVLLLLTLLFISGADRAEAVEISEISLKSALIARIPQFTYWPESISKHAKLDLCVWDHAGYQQRLLNLRFIRQMRS